MIREIALIYKMCYCVPASVNHICDWEIIACLQKPINRFELFIIVIHYMIIIASLIHSNSMLHRSTCGRWGKGVGHERP